MPDNTRVQADPAGAEMPSKRPDSVASSLAIDSLQDITEIARKLAAHGGGLASFDLALDLVLHEIVEEARISSGATGAAIALIRDGRMVCRATTGENAPDLGVSVEAASGLTGTCLKTKAIQHCEDTETDLRVDPDTCRRLGVRSMLLIPLVDAEGTFGVLQVFSSSPNTFGEQELATLLRLADRVAENRRPMLQNLNPAPPPGGLKFSMPDQLKPKRSDREATPNDNVFQSEPATASTNEIWTAVLFLLVIITAISLGIVVGWSNGRRATITPRVRPELNAVSTERTQVLTRSPAQDAASDSTATIDPSYIHDERKSVQVPQGSLVVTVNGKVIYRSPASLRQQDPTQSASKPGLRELIHRVEPEYPPQARAQHIEGMVVLDVEVGEEGNVAETAVVSGDPLLTGAAVQAVKQWRYQPNPGGGAFRTRVELQFTLPVN
jgi:TonB family protein